VPIDLNNYLPSDGVELKPLRMLSMGGGIQTTAMLLMFPERYDFVVFADVSKGTRFDEKKNDILVSG